MNARDHHPDAKGLALDIRQRWGLLRVHCRGSIFLHSYQLDDEISAYFLTTRAQSRINIVWSGGRLQIVQTDYDRVFAFLSDDDTRIEARLRGIY
jgi:hypothetical protein